LDKIKTSILRQLLILLLLVIVVSDVGLYLSIYKDTSLLIVLSVRISIIAVFLINSMFLFHNIEEFQRSGNK